MDKIKNILNQIASSGGKPLLPTGPTVTAKDLADLRECMRKLAEHDERLKAVNTELFKLDTDKAEKLYVEGEFKRVNRELEQLREWFSKLEDKFKLAIANANSNNVSIDLMHRVEKLETIVSNLVKLVEELRNSKTMGSSIGFSETRDTLADDLLNKDINNKLNSLH